MVGLASGTWVRVYRRGMCSPHDTSAVGLGCASESCTLPTVDQPVRVAEFDDFFSESVRAVERVDATTLRLLADSVAADRAGDLAGRESSSCSFFGFDFAAAGTVAGMVSMRITALGAYVAVLDPFAARAAAGLDVATGGR
jgi:hypothetical protein